MKGISAKLLVLMIMAFMSTNTLAEKTDQSLTILATDNETPSDPGANADQTPADPGSNDDESPNDSEESDDNSNYSDATDPAINPQPALDPSPSQ